METIKFGDFDHDAPSAKYIVSGDTRPHAATLKAAGLKFDGRVWIGTDVELYELRSLSIRLRTGSRAAVKELLVTVAPNITAPVATDHDTGRNNVHADPYNRDANGNRVFGQRRIAGGSPDDFE